MPVHVGKDRMLNLTRSVLATLMGLASVCAITALILIPAVFVKRQELSASGLGETNLGEAVALWLTLLLVLAALAALLGFLFLRELRRIVDSVSNGSPFAPTNANRLRSMAWLALAVQPVLMALKPLILWFDAAPFETNPQLGDGLSIGGICLALVLFILARVIRVGGKFGSDGT